MHSLPIFLRLHGRPVIVIGIGEAADSKRRILERAGAVIVDATADAQLAVVALEDDTEANAIVAELKVRGILVNATDRPALCDFTLPAIIDRDPVIIAIGTGGASAGLAAALRQQFESLLPHSLGALAQQLFAARAALKKQWPLGADRRRALGAALSKAGALDPLAAQTATAVADWLETPPTADALSHCHNITLRTNDPDDLTLREARLLGQADAVYHTQDVPEDILERARADAPRVCCAEPPMHKSGVFLTFSAHH